MPIASANPPFVLTVDQFKGLNQQNRRASIDDQELFWNENLYAIAPGALRSMWGPSAPIYTAPAGKTILRIFFGFLGYQLARDAQPPPGRLGWMFLSDGSIDQVDLDLGTVTHVGDNVWQPIAPKYWASAVVWRPMYFGQVAGQIGGVLFGSPLGLFAWDGLTLYRPGDPAPDWLTNAAETGATPPTGGTFVMPSGLPGIYCMEVYQARLFVAGKDVISFSAPGNGADFSDFGGGGSIGYFGNKLTYSYMDLAATAGFLLVFGDSSIDVISNITLFGQGTPAAPYTTNFQYQNVDPMVGQRFPRPVGRWGRYTVTWNGAGLYELQGGEAIPIANKWSNLFDTLVLPVNTGNATADAAVNVGRYYPTFATMTKFGFRLLLCNGRFTDPFGVTRNLLLMWNGNFWTVCSQRLELTNIGHYEDNSVIRPFGTDGTNLYELFQAPDPTLIKRLGTKALKGDFSQQSHLIIRNWRRVFLEVHDNTGEGVAITGSLHSTGGPQPGGTDSFGFQLVPGKRYDIIPVPTTGFGITAALDLESLSPDFTIERIHLMLEERTLWAA